MKPAHYIGIGAAVLVPALVIAQQQRNPPTDGTFAPQTLLRAADVEQMRDALADALVRINQLESNSGPVLIKANLYPVSSPSNAAAEVAPNAQASVRIACDDANDILINCGCQALIAGGNTAIFDFRRQDVSQLANEASSCLCQGINGPNDNRALVANATCLRVP